MYSPTKTNKAGKQSNVSLATAGTYFKWMHEDKYQEQKQKTKTKLLIQTIVQHPTERDYPVDYPEQSKWIQSRMVNPIRSPCSKEQKNCPKIKMWCRQNTTKQSQCEGWRYNYDIVQNTIRHRTTTYITAFKMSYALSYEHNYYIVQNVINTHTNTCIITSYKMPCMVS